VFDALGMALRRAAAPSRIGWRWSTPPSSAPPRGGSLIRQVS